MSVEVGSILEGKVTGVKNFGAFVQLADGTTGLVHISEVSNEYVQDLSDILNEGQLVKVKVVSVNPEGKIALSIKKADATNNKPKPQARRADTGPVWQPKQQNKTNTELSFEDMMSKFKSQSEEKISDLKRATDARRGGYSRRR